MRTRGEHIDRQGMGILTDQRDRVIGWITGRMTIRQATYADLESLMNVFEGAKKIMRSSGERLI